MPCKIFRPLVTSGRVTVICCWCGFHRQSHETTREAAA